ncbi:Lrp/AsnC family transcriptional regulator [Micromonospora zamorensis]|uniref:Lrp/AsnC family transcriptional regulator n=1 Tax=Micromonospora zamorensis TaxID=709883 RepID=UPI003D97D2B2
MAFQLEKALDDVDWQIIRELQQDGRLSIRALGRRVNLSAPAVGERVRRLEDFGVITGYQARINPRLAGYPLLAFVELRCTRGQCLLSTSSAAEHPEIVEVHKLSGGYCSMLKVRTTSLEHLEGLLERLGRHGDVRSSVVLSSQHEDDRVTPPHEAYRGATRHEGWQPR